MEELLAREQAAERQVFALLKQPDEPISVLLEAFVAYRHLCLAAILADFKNAEQAESRLWQAHCAGKNYFHSALSNLRKKHAQQQQPVETRKLMKLYLEFIKRSQLFYREYIFKLSSSSVGIPELVAVAQMQARVKDQNNSSGESQQLLIAPELRGNVLKSTHQTLIYLGDLSRWRASEQLDKTPDFGPAIGYYGLAATLVPASGMGHHQQAVVELEQRHHLYAIYHLYRALVVAHPHPNAASNLHSEFKKTNAAWERGELIKKGPPHDPDAPKRALIGWFIRLHSICYKGQAFSGYDELEREVLTQSANGVKQRLADDKYEKLMRKMVLVNFAAQYWAGQRFQSDPDKHEHQQSFFYFFRFNLATFTTFLRIFNDELRSRLLDLEDNDAELAVKVTPIMRRILPCLRLYSVWLLAMIHMVVGLANESFMQETIAQFWPAYARVVDLIAQGFPIWDLEDVEDVTYMLEEDSDTIEFQPLIDEKTRKLWWNKQTGMLKQQSTDVDVVKSSEDDEMLQRIKDLLSYGLYLANDDDTAPIKLHGTRIFHGNEDQIDDLVVRPVDYQAVLLKEPSAISVPKPISYATAAANGHAKQSRPVAKQAAMPESESRLDQLKNMVADLVDDDDGNNPVTPPQLAASHPAILMNGDHQLVAPPAEQDNSRVQKYNHAMTPPSNTWSHRASATLTPPTARASPSTVIAPHERLQSVGHLWNQSPSYSPAFTPHAPTGALVSPAGANARGHSRVNSASSNRSRTSQNMTDAWASPKSPFLYGAGPVWGNGSTRPGSFRNISPPNGQGG